MARNRNDIIIIGRAGFFSPSLQREFGNGPIALRRKEHQVGMVVLRDESLGGPLRLGGRGPGLGLPDLQVSGRPHEPQHDGSATPGPLGRPPHLDARPSAGVPRLG